MQENNTTGTVIWITGLSGTGKTTLARRLQKEVVGSVLIDGDDIREVLNNLITGYETETRKKLAFTYSKLAKLLSNQGVTVIISTISLFHEIHSWNRNNLSRYLEVFIDISEQERLKRKQLKQSKSNQEIDYVNIKDPVVHEFPFSPDIRFEDSDSLEIMIDKITSHINLIMMQS